MFKPSVNTSTPASRWMQILCLTVFWLCWMAAPLGVSAQQASSDGPVTAAQALSDQVRQWMASAHKVNAKEVNIAPLDERLKVQACSKPLVLDHPFASRETVRARCTDPTWQLFLQVSMPAGNFVSPQNAGSSAGSAGGGAARPLVVAKRLLQRGTLLQPDMLEEIQASTPHADSQLLSSIKDVHQAELTRDIPAGQPLRVSDIKRAVLVKQGQTVMLAVGEKSNFQILIRMEALQDGRMGDQVKLRNPESGRQVSGVVTGLNTAKGL
jgi:flagella basal body P-ring formation protein FlgA